MTQGDAVSVKVVCAALGNHCPDELLVAVLSASPDRGIQRAGRVSLALEWRLVIRRGCSQLHETLRKEDAG